MKIRQFSIVWWICIAGAVPLLWFGLCVALIAWS
jgi:hypothetical protein